MRATPIPSSWINDEGDIILQQPEGAWTITVRVTVDDLHALWEEARGADSETARWSGHLWHRDHLNGAMQLAVDSGLIDTCRAVDGRQMCERPLRHDETRCPNHAIGATA